MTETNAPSAHSSDANATVRSADILLNLVVIFLAPVFLSASNGDIALARLAAIETVSAYRANSHADLLAVAQIIAFGFATLGSLCLSMADDISLTMVLRLRGNANALSRSAEVHRRRLEHSADISPPQPPIQADDPRAKPAVATPAPPPHPIQPAEKDATPAPVPTPSAIPATDPSQAPWAAAFAEAAEQVIAELPNLPPAEQRMAAIQAAALNECASNLLAEANAQRPEAGQDDPDTLYPRPNPRSP